MRSWVVAACRHGEKGLVLLLLGPAGGGDLDISLREGGFESTVVNEINTGKSHNGV